MENSHNSISIRIQNIQETEFSCIYDFDYDLMNSDLLEVGLKFETNIIAKDNICNIDLSVRYKYEEKILLTLGVLFGFEITPIYALMDENEEEAIPEDLLLNMLNIAVGAIRGILFLKMQNTPLHKYYLPIFSISFINDMIKKGVNKKN